MNVLDQIFGWLMIAFGVAQSVTNFRIQSSSHLTLSLSGTAAAMIVGGFLNVSRARHSDGLTRAFSVIACGGDCMAGALPPATQLAGAGNSGRDCYRTVVCLAGVRCPSSPSGQSNRFDPAVSGSVINMTEVFSRRDVVANQPLQFLDLGKAALIFS